MSHYAKVLNGKVINVIVADEDFMSTFTDTTPGKWLKTDKMSRGGVKYDSNGNPTNEPHLRYNYAGKGALYDANADAFYSPQPFSSWTLDTDSYTWVCPVEYPNDGNSYLWNEDNQTWDAVE